MRNLTIHYHWNKWAAEERVEEHAAGHAEGHAGEHGEGEEEQLLNAKREEIALGSKEIFPKTIVSGLHPFLGLLQLCLKIMTQSHSFSSFSIRKLSST